MGDNCPLKVGYLLPPLPHFLLQNNMLFMVCGCWGDQAQEHCMLLLSIEDWTRVQDTGNHQEGLTEWLVHIAMRQ